MKLISILLLTCFGAMAQAPASEAPPPQPTLQTLLGEVHQLRLALERSIGPRVQIAVERIKIQQEQVARSIKQADEARRELEHCRTEEARIQQQLQGAEGALNSTADANERKAAEESVGQLKLQAELAEKATQAVQVRESEASGQLQAEQGKLSELNERLNQIERVLGNL